MNVTQLQQKLIAAARARVPEDQVPWGFEKRIVALIRSRAATDPLALWVRGLWRAAVPCVAIAVLLGAWFVLTPASNANANDLSESFETTLLASVGQGDQMAPLPGTPTQGAD
ncbi:MAG: hypothetical protein KGJ60_15230 [Verrucomicrobiota bacterium]|nr:hypothetical protein [Verrucomicrobiota bacterium]